MRFISRLIYLLVLFLFISSITYATDYYVDKNASGSNNGTSWANAWQSIGSIVESSLEPGDVVYISGGTNSKIYYESVTLTDIVGTAANFITIRNSYESGHNGRVIIDGNNYTLSNAGLELQNCHYVYVKGIEIRRFNGGNDPGSLTASNGCNVVTFDSMLVYDNYGRHVRFSGDDALPTAGCTTSCVDSITIKNSYIVTSRWGLGQTDCIYAMGAKNIFIDNNYIRMAMNWNWSNDQHSDPIQAYQTRGWKITNNHIIADQNTFANSIILGAAGVADSVIIYNNFIIGTGTPTRTGITDLTVLYMREYGGGYPPTVVLHNTVISYGPNYYNARQEYPITYAANNVFAQYGDGEGEYHAMITNSTGSQVIPVSSFDTNLYYREWAAPNWTGSWTGNGNTGSISGWSSWTNTYGGNGVNDNPDLQYDFSNYDTTDLINYTMEDWRNGLTPTITGVLTSNSPARNQGLNLQSVVEGMGLEWKDINGNPRDNSPTIGAFEYEDGPDLTPPIVTGATLLDSITLVVNFSESIDETTAENENNYSISNNIDVFNASLSGSKVTLQTSTHSSGSYTVTVVNVEDLAGNPIAPPSNTAEYEYVVLPPDTLIMLPVQNVEGIIIEPEHTPEKTIDGLGALDGDPDSRWSAEPMPEELIFDLGTNRTICKTRLSFYNWNAGRVYNYSISVSSDNNNWVTIIPQAASASNEEWTINEFSPVDARYVMVHFINNNQSDWAGLWEGEIWGLDTSTQNDTNTNGLPDNFVLYQNYPNPFNPSTKIKFSVSQESNINLSIYNVLGELVATLVNKQLKPGYYEYEFNAEQSSSGIYLYRIISGEFVETKKMILMK